MSKMASFGTRPNIRIEIQNNLAEPMDVDENEKVADSDFEDGEINDKNEPTPEITALPKPANRTWNNIDGGFTTGLDIFDKKEQEKLQERANRFGLKQDEINNFTDEHLQKLHISLGITVETEKTVRFEAVHMRGTDEMSTEDIFEYFGKYGPAYIEWINDESCNVIWQDRISAARALHFISKPIKGVPVEGPCDPFIKESVENETDKNTRKEEVEEGRSILLKNREVQLEKEDADLNDEEKTETSEDYVALSDILVPVPPGYWRLGIEHPKTKGVLLRFAFKTDKKAFRAERFSEYYKKYGNPNFGGMKGLISESRRKKFKGIFDRNKDINTTPIQDNKNPWGDLAENWNEDEQFCEKLPYIKNQKEILNNGPEKSDVLKRLGTKRTHESDDESVDNQESPKKKSKIPRMRMYADEEEAKMKRKKQLLEVKLSERQGDAKQVQDLRNIIGITTKKTDREPQEPAINSNDLGSKLKNRIKKGEKIKCINHRLTVSKSGKKKELQDNRENSEKLSRHRSPTQNEGKHYRNRKVSPTFKARSRHEHANLHYKSRMHSDRYEHQRYSFSDDFDQHKPKSKVAVVIKTQKRPAVASTVWSRINLTKERLKTASERLQHRKDSSTSSESSSESNSSGSSSSESSSSDTSSESEDSNEESNKEPQVDLIVPKVERPGFSNHVQTASRDVSRRKSPLRIEISNDHFKEE